MPATLTSAKIGHRQLGHDPPLGLRVEIEAELTAFDPAEKLAQVGLFGHRMRHHMRDPLDVGRHAIDENALLQFQPHCKVLLLGERQSAFEIGPRNRMQADDTPVVGHTTGAVERHHAVVRNSFERSEIVRGAPRGDKEPYAALMRLRQCPARRSGNFMRTETDQRPVHIQKNRPYHRL